MGKKSFCLNDLFHFEAGRFVCLFFARIIFLSYIFLVLSDTHIHVRRVEGRMW